MSIAEALARVVMPHLGDTFPACSACVLHHGEMLLNHAWGWIDPETRRIPAQTDTLFDLASLTKLYTTTAFLRCVSDGRVALDDPLYTIIPEFAAAAPRPIDGGVDPHSRQPLPVDPALDGLTVDPRAVTFRHLLTHTSGLPPWQPVYRAVGDAPPPDHQCDPLSRAERRARAAVALCAYPFVGFPDGHRVRYSDVGCMLLGEGVMRLTGNDLPSDPVDRGTTVVYNPLRDHTIARQRIAPTEDDPVWRGRRCWGEVHDENACALGGAGGHAGLFGTAEAVARFGERWRTGDLPGIAPQVRAEAVRQQVEDGETRRGLGFALRARGESMVGRFASEETFGHSGFTGTTLWIDPRAGSVVVLLTNRVYPGRDHDGAAGSITDFRTAAHEAIALALAG